MESKALRITVTGLERGVRPDRRLVYQDDVVQPLRSLELPVHMGGVARFVFAQSMGDRGVQHVVYQGGLPRSGNTGDADQHAHGNLHVQAGQVVNAGAA